MSIMNNKKDKNKSKLCSVKKASKILGLSSERIRTALNDLNLGRRLGQKIYMDPYDIYRVGLRRGQVFVPKSQDHAMTREEFFKWWEKEGYSDGINSIIEQMG